MGDKVARVRGASMCCIHVLSCQGVLSFLGMEAQSTVTGAWQGDGIVTGPWQDDRTVTGP
jgi:hypothetical protein